MTTNREKLAKMTNEELAEFFNIDGLCNLCIYNDITCENKDCYEGALKWLQSEEIMLKVKESEE